MPLIDLKPFEVAMTRQKAVGRGMEGTARLEEEGWSGPRGRRMGGNQERDSRKKHAGSESE